MARRLYSVVLFQAVGLTGLQNTPLVPAGHVWVLRDIDVYNSTNFVVAQLHVHGPIGQTIAFFAGRIQSDISLTWRGRQVFPAGTGIGFDANIGQWDIMASGYDLLSP